MKNIVFFGECMLEDSQVADFCFGGDTLNTAIYLKRTASKQLNVMYATAIGIDPDSQQLLDAWQRELIDTKLVQRIPNRQLGRYQILLDDRGERQFSYQRKNSAATAYFEQENTPLETLLLTKKIDYFYVSGISFAILPDSAKARLLTCIDKFKQQGGTVIFDNNYRPALWQNSNAQHYYQQIMKLTNIALLTDEDEYLLFGDSTPEQIIERAKNWGVAEIVIKRGDKPCIVSSDNGLEIVPTTPLQDVIDTCAAGDAFAAGYLSRRLQGESCRVSAELGHQLAAVVIQYMGAIAPRAAICKLMKNTRFSTNERQS